MLFKKCNILNKLVNAILTNFDRPLQLPVVNLKCTAATEASKVTDYIPLHITTVLILLLRMKYSG